MEGNLSFVIIFNNLSGKLFSFSLNSTSCTIMERKLHCKWSRIIQIFKLICDLQYVNSKLFIHSYLYIQILISHNKIIEPLINLKMNSDSSSVDFSIGRGEEKLTELKDSQWWSRDRVIWCLALWIKNSINIHPHH